MAHEIIALIAQYGVLLVFFNVLVTQLGAPLPAVPTLVVAGALAAGGQLPVFGVLLVTVVACLLSDALWYAAGRRYGASDAPVALIASGALATLYGAALDLAGLAFRTVDADEAVRAGLVEAARENGMIGDSR